MKLGRKFIMYKTQDLRDALIQVDTYVDEIIELVKNNYEIDSSQLDNVKNDIGSFLSKLEEKTLVYQGDQK